MKIKNNFIVAIFFCINLISLSSCNAPGGDEEVVKTPPSQEQKIKIHVGLSDSSVVQGAQLSATISLDETLELVKDVTEEVISSDNSVAEVIGSSCLLNNSNRSCIVRFKTHTLGSFKVIAKSANNTQDFTSNAVAVVDKPILTISHSSGDVVAGDVIKVTVAISGGAKISDTAVKLYGYDPKNVNLATTNFYLSNDKLSQDIEVTGLNKGISSIVASSGGYTESMTTITVVNKAGIAVDGVTPDQKILKKGSITATFTIADTAKIRSEPMTLSGYDPKFIKVTPSSFTLTDADPTQDVTIEAIDQGATSITATAEGYDDLSVPITVVPEPVISITTLSSDKGIANGLTKTAQVSISAGAKIGKVIVNIEDHNNNVKISPRTIDLDDEHLSKGIAITGLVEGSTQIKATSEKYATAYKDIVVSHPVISNIFSGLGTNCVMSSIGKVYCAGDNRYGEAGGPTDSFVRTATQIQSNFLFSNGSGGRFNLCATARDTGLVSCWGFNEYGQIGQGKLDNARYLPSQISSSNAFKAVASGEEHACALTADSNQIYCWGNNARGQLGNGSYDKDNKGLPNPGVINTNIKFTTVTAKGARTCALDDNNSAYCWGLSRTNSSVSKPDALRPKMLESQGLKFTSVTTELYRSCVLTTAQDVYCLDVNDDRLVKLDTKLKFTSIVSGDSHTCGITSMNEAYCWGTNYRGELGNGTKQEFSDIVKVSTTLKFIQLSAGSLYTCGLTDDYHVYCWGDGFGGKFGNGKDDVELVPVPAFETLKS